MGFRRRCRSGFSCDYQAPASVFELSPSELEALQLSLRVAFWSMLVSLPLAILAALVLARSSFPGKSIVDAVIHLPLVLPPVVIGYFLLLLLGRRGPLGGWLEQTFGIVVAFRWTGAAIAAAVMGFPLMVRAIRMSIEAIDANLEAAASTLGANPAWIFVTITLPLAAPGIITGTLLFFARSLGEFGATITFVSNIPGETRTLPLAIYTYTQVPGGDPQALRLSLISVVVSIAALFVSELLARRVHRRVIGHAD
jgi:molybdate transport system permease protein